MTFGRKDVPITRPDGGANVFGLAEFLRDDDLVSHDGLVWKNRFDSWRGRTYSEQARHATRLLTASRKGQIYGGTEWRLDIISAVSGKNCPLLAPGRSERASS